MSNQRNEILNVNNLMQAHYQERAPNATEIQPDAETGLTHPATTAQIQASSAAVGASGEQQSAAGPPPYHERATNREVIVLTSTLGNTSHPQTRTPPPPYHPVMYVYPKDDYRRNLNNKLNLWVFIILAISIGSLLLGLINKYILVTQNRAAVHGH